MNKILSIFKDAMPMVMLVLSFVLILIPLPLMMIQALIVLNICFSLCLFLFRFFKSTVLAYYFPRLVLYSSLYTLGIAIAATRTFLCIQTLDGHIPVVLFIGQWICRENYVCGFFTTLMLCGSLLLFCKLHIQRAQEAAANFYLDRMNQKLFDIDKQIEQKYISIEEGDAQKKKLQDETDYHDCMDGAARFLIGTIVAFVILFIITIVGGTAMGISDQNMYWQDALNQYIMLSSGYLVLFVIPLSLTSMGFKTYKDL